VKNLSRWLIGLGCFVALAALPSAASSQDWLQGYADATNSGFSSSAMTATPRLVWGLVVKDPDRSTLHPNSGSAVHNGVLFTSADKNPLKIPGAGWSEFLAIDANTGQRLWTFDPQVPGAIHDGLVAVDVARSQVIYPAHDGNLRALDTSTGALLWTIQVCDPLFEICDIEGGVTLANGRAFYVADDFLHAFVPDRVNPFEIWRFSRGEIAHGVATKPVVSGGKVYFGGFGRFWALDELTGALIWQSPTSQPNFTYGFDIPHLWNNTVYASASRSGYKQTIVTARDAATGAVKWDQVLRLGFAVKSSIGYGKWFLSFWEGPHQGGVIALDLATGRTLWKFDRVNGVAVAPINGGPAVVDNKVIFGASDGTIYMLDQATGHLIWSDATRDATHASVAVADGKFFLGAYRTFRAYGP
jgi:outer membrane protein assembly factor BamB